MNIASIREIMGLTVEEAAAEMGISPRLFRMCETTFLPPSLYGQFLRAFPINPDALLDDQAEPFLPSFEPGTPGERLEKWCRERKLKLSDAPGQHVDIRQAQQLEAIYGIPVRYLMYGDGRTLEARPEDQRVAPLSLNGRSLGRLIRQARERLDVNQAVMAQMTGLRTEDIAQMEAGQVTAEEARDVLERFQRAGGISVHDLMAVMDNGVQVQKAERQEGAGEAFGHPDAWLDEDEWDVLSAYDRKQAWERESNLADNPSGEKKQERQASAPQRRGDGPVKSLRTVWVQDAASPHHPAEEGDAPGHRLYIMMVTDMTGNGARIRAAREQAGLTVEQASACLEIPPRRMYQMEWGLIEKDKAGDVLKRLSMLPASDPLLSVLNDPGLIFRNALTVNDLTPSQAAQVLNLSVKRVKEMMQGSLSLEEARDASEKLGIHLPEDERIDTAKPEDIFQEARRSAQLSLVEAACVLNLSSARAKELEEGKVTREKARGAARELSLRFLEEDRK